MRIVLQPAGAKDATQHYVDTIQNRVSASRILAALSEAEQQIVRRSLESRAHVSVWGVTPGKNDVNRNKWAKIARGDIVLFAKHGRIFASSAVVGTLHSPALARILWKETTDGETWEYVYFLDVMHSQDIPYATLNRVVGYKPNKIVQGFSVLDEDRSESLVRYFRLRD